MDYYLNDKVLIKDRNIKGTVVDIININVQSAGFKIGNEMFDLKSAEGSENILYMEWLRVKKNKQITLFSIYQRVG